MRACLIVSVILVLLKAGPLSAQAPAARADTGRVLVLEHRFAGGAPDSVIVGLVRRVVYRATTDGRAAPTFKPLRGYKWAALVVPFGKDAAGRAKEFEVHASETGAHLVSIEGLPPGSEVTLRLYRDDTETRRNADANDRDFATGLSFGGGFHSGYRLDPAGSASPGGGGDVEGCILAETGNWFSACLGVGRQSLPDASLTVTWYFIEPRARFLSRPLLGDHRTDLGASVRFAQASEVQAGTGYLSPSLLAAGLYLTQHLSPDNRRRGWSMYTAWQHGWLGNVPETERRSTDRFTAGLTWVP